MVLGSAELVFATTNTAARMWPSKDALVLTRRFDCVAPRLFMAFTTGIRLSLT